LDMYGAKYQWILAGKYANDWWRGVEESVRTTSAAAAAGNEDEDERQCGEQTLRVALDGFICADILVLSALQQPTVADLVCISLYDSRRLPSAQNHLS